MINLFLLFSLTEKRSEVERPPQRMLVTILLLALDDNPKTTLVCVYSPTNSSSLEEIEDFYTTLRTTIEQVPLHNFLVIAGDLNAKLGSDEARFSFNSKTNRNGGIANRFYRRIIFLFRTHIL